MILFVAGDVGGARALLPVIAECARRQVPFSLVDHGLLAREGSPSWPAIAAPTDLSPTKVATWLTEHKIALLAFTSSVHDTFPLTLARAAQGMGLPVLHLLDNWSNYRRRLEHDGLPLLLPDLYAVMDELAAAGAVDGGIPAERIAIVGQPGLAALAEEFVEFSPGVPENDQLHLLFVSEPVDADQGSGPESPEFRGYTERTVLALLCQALQPYADQLLLSLLPHPRENRDVLAETWQAVRGGLAGEILVDGNGRQQVLAADGVIGMASILLYEAWLLGKPVLSLQPGLRIPALRALAGRAGLQLVEEQATLGAAVKGWLPLLRRGASSPRPDLLRHQGAAVRICDRLADLLASRNHGVIARRKIR